MPIVNSTVHILCKIWHEELVNIYDSTIGEGTKIASFVEIGGSHIGRQCKIEAVFCFETVKQAGGNARELDRHAAKSDIPGGSNRRIERQNRAGNRRLKQDAVAVERPFTGDIGRRPQKAGDLFYSRQRFAKQIDIETARHPPDKTFCLSPSEEDIGIAGKLPDVGIAEQVRQLF